MKDSITLDDFRTRFAHCDEPFSPEALELLVELIGYAPQDDIVRLRDFAYQQSLEGAVETDGHTPVSSYDRFFYGGIRHALQRIT